MVARKKSKKSREQSSNVGYVCPKHALKPRPEVYADRPIESFVGKMVKLGFEVEPEPPEFKERFPDKHWPSIEHMWVEVRQVAKNKKELHGIVSNDPLFAGVEFGQGILFTPDEIEAVAGEEEIRG